MAILKSYTYFIYEAVMHNAVLPSMAKCGKILIKFSISNYNSLGTA
jgi:hypothetical protein